MMLMDSVLRPYIGKFVVVFLDDILVYSKTLEEHLEHLRKIFHLLRENSLYAKESKWEFPKTKVQYLGHVISNKSIEMDPDKVDAIVQWLAPKNMEEL